MTIKNCRNTGLLHGSRCRERELGETCKNLRRESEFIPCRHIHAVILPSLFKRRKGKTGLQVWIPFWLCFLGFDLLGFLLLFVFRFLLIICGLSIGGRDGSGLLVRFTVTETTPFFTVVFSRWLL
jgi:hypothetical protein